MFISTAARHAALAGLILIAACGSDYEDTWGEGDLLSGKADGLADFAIPVTIGETVTGSVDEQSLLLYQLPLVKGDKVTVTKTVTDGDLAPHFTLFKGVTDTIFAASFEVDDKVLVKGYTIEETATYIIVVRAFRNRGAGSFSVKIECSGGPCAGQPTDEALTNAEADDCMARAQTCAFEEMRVFNGAVGTARARSLFEQCLAKHRTPDGGFCSEACRPALDDFDSAPAEVCADVIASLPHFADNDNRACMNALTECMDECGSLADSTAETLDDMAFSRCWTFGSNGTCPGYATGLEVCGGEIEQASNAECHSFCESTTGAWTDDLDLLCVEECD